MHTGIFTKILKGVLVFFALVSTFSLSAQDFFGIVPHGKIGYEMDTLKVILRFKNDFSELQRQELLRQYPLFEAYGKEMELDTPRVVLMPLRPGATKTDVNTLINELRLQHAILMANPMMVDERGISLGCTEVLAIGLKSLNDFHLLKEDAARYHLTFKRMDKYNPEIIFFSVTPQSPGNALEVANLLAASGKYAFAEPDYLQLIRGHTNDPLNYAQWAIKNTGNWPGSTAGADMKVEQAWDITTGGSNIWVAILDDGVQLNHPDLAGNIVAGHDATGLGSNGAPTYSQDAHGTACAGIVGAVANNGTGVAGVAYGSRLMAIRIAYNAQSGSWTTTSSILASGINWAWQNGADVLSNSWGSGFSSLIETAISNAVNNGRGGLGCPVLFATGNDNESAIGYPSSNPNTIAVGATSFCDQRKSSTSCDGENWWGSNYGSGIDVMAPGVKIVTTDLTGTSGYNTNNSNFPFNADYVGNFNGTSSACPNAAGVMALILSANPNLTLAQARYHLESTCDKVGGVTYGSGGSGNPNGTWSSQMGHGRVNARKAVESVVGSLTMTTNISATPNPVNQGGQMQFAFNIRNSGANTFNGVVSIDLYNSNGNYLAELAVTNTFSLCANCTFSSNLVFNNITINQPPGIYTVIAWYRATGSLWQQVLDGNFNNQVQIQVVSPNLTVSPTSHTFSASGGNQAFSVSSNVAWTVSGLPNWLTTSTPSGTGNGSFVITCTANTSTSSRTAQFTVSGGGITRTISITQQGVSPSLSVSPTSYEYPVAGGTYLFQVISNVSWTVGNLPAWLSTNTSSGNNNGSFSITCQANGSSSARSAFFTVSGGGQNVTVAITQPGVSLNVSVSPTNHTFPATGGNHAFTVSSNINWMLSNLPAWLSAAPSSGANNGNFTLTCQSNTSTSSRTAQITVGGSGQSATVSVTQQGASASLSISPTSYTYGSGGGSHNFGISSNVSWTISNLPGWASATPTSGSNNGAVTITCTPNTSIIARSAQITVQGGGQNATLTIIQQGASATLFVSPTAYTFSGAGGNHSFQVTSNVSWNLDNLPAWLSATPASGIDNGGFSLSCQANGSTTSRSAQIAVIGGGQTTTISITQTGSAPALSLTPLSHSFPSSGGMLAFDVNSNTNWIVNGVPNWLTVQPFAGSGNGSFGLTCQENTSTSSRSAQFTVEASGQTVTISITQQGLSSSLDASPLNHAFAAGGGSHVFAVTSNTNWNVTGLPAWLSAVPGSGSNSGNFTLTCEPNPGTMVRNAQITLQGGTQNVIITIAQQGAAPSLAINPQQHVFAGNGGIQNIAVSANVAWMVASGYPNWIQFTSTSGNSNGSTTIECAPNPSSFSRSAILTFEGGGQTATLSVTQSGAAPSLAVTPNNHAFAASGGDHTFTVTGNVPWTLSNPPAWLNFSTLSGANNGGFTATCSANNGTTSRSAQFTLQGGGQTVILNITQQGQAPQVSVSPTSMTFSAAGGNQSFAVTSNTNWSVENLPAWITSTSTNGAGNGTFELQCEANNIAASRSSLVEVSAGNSIVTIQIVQEGADATIPWTANLTGENHTVIIPATLTATLDGAPLQNGDVIGFFYEHNGSLHCSNYAAITGANNSVAVYGNDAIAPAKNGFTVGEAFKLKIYRIATQQEFDAQAVFAPVGTAGLVSHTNQYANDGISMLTSISATSAITLDIPLQQGWNMISSNVLPLNSNMLTLFSPIASSIILVKNNPGQTAIPSLNINNIGSWNIVEGYKVRANANATLSIAGARANPEITPIPITQGWQIIAYLRTQQASAQSQLAGIASIVEIVKDNAGNTYIPEYNINTIGNMRPTQGYKLKASASGTLTYPANFAPDEEENPQLASSVEKRGQRHFNLDSTFNTGNNSVIIFPATVAGALLEPGDEIGIFTATGILCGAAIFQGANFAVTVWGDDPTTPDVQEGMMPGEAYRLRTWKQAEGLEMELNAEFSQGNGIYQEDGVSVVSLLNIVSSTTDQRLVAGKLEVFPNPAKQYFTVQLPGDIQVLELRNAEGKLLRRISKPADTLFRFDTSEYVRSPVWISAIDGQGRRWYAKVLLQ